jgi:hypothetical protein
LGTANTGDAAKTVKNRAARNLPVIAIIWR